MERILIVEDDRFSQALFMDLLRSDGYETECVDSARDALQRLQSDEFRVVIINLVIPDMSGLELLSRIKQRDPAMEVIIVTNHGNTDSAIAALKNGARDYLVKPINHEEFRHTVSLCIEQRQLLDENTELKELVNLFQTSQTIANCIETDRLYGLVFEALRKEVGVDRGVACFLESDFLLVKGVRGIREESAQKVAEALIRLFPGEAEKPGSCKRVDNFLGQEARQKLLLPDDMSDALLLYIKSRNSFQGLLILFNPPGENLPDRLNVGHIAFILDQASLALENAGRYSKARELLNVDELTGLYNYRYLDIALEHEIHRSERFSSGFAVIFLDIDLLKRVNDTHGHLVGSKVLKEMGALLKRSLRDVDIIIRYGGDEFTIILVESTLDASAAVAERIRRNVENHLFLEDDGFNLTITASLGYACYPIDTRSKQELLEMADQAMYHSKFSGKNRVFHISSLIASRGRKLDKEE